jgi:hypothetical protein
LNKNIDKQFKVIENYKGVGVQNKKRLTSQKAIRAFNKEVSDI